MLLGHIHRNCASVDLSPYEHLFFENVLEIVEVVANSRHAFILALSDLEDLTATNLCTLLSSGLIPGMCLGKHQVGDLKRLLNAIDATGVARFNVPELYPRSFAPIDLDRIRSRQEFEQFGMFRPWKSPVPSLPRPKHFPITQLVFAQISASRTPPAKLRRTLKDWVVTWSEALNFKERDQWEPDFLLLSLPMSDYFLSAADSIKTLPRVLSHMIRSNENGNGLEAGGAVLGMLRRLALKVSRRCISFTCGT
jgi:hypothetical protein